MAESGCLHTSSLNTINADNRVMCNNYNGDRIVVPETGTITDPTLYETNGKEGDILSLNQTSDVLSTSSNTVSVSIVWPKGTYIQDMSFMIVDADPAVSGPNITMSNNGSSASDALYIKLGAVKDGAESGIMGDKIIVANSDTVTKIITLYKNIPINFIRCSTGILGADTGGIIPQMSGAIEHDTENYNHSFNIMDSNDGNCWTHGTTEGYPLYNPSDSNSRDSVRITFTKANTDGVGNATNFSANENKLKIMVICTFIKVDLVEIENP